MVWAMTCHSRASFRECLQVGVRAARRSVECDYAVNPDLSAADVRDIVARIRE